MDILNPPQSFGVFSPVGHIVIAFASTEPLEAAAADLQTQGFAPDALLRYTPAAMQAQVAADIKTASPLASLGQDLNIVKAHGALADKGCSFLIVHAPDDAQAEKVAVVARQHKAVAAQRYGAFIIEELITPPSASPQVFESPDKGLDLKVAQKP